MHDYVFGLLWLLADYCVFPNRMNRIHKRDKNWAELPHHLWMMPVWFIHEYFFLSTDQSSDLRWLESSLEKSWSHVMIHWLPDWWFPLQALLTSGLLPLHPAPLALFTRGDTHLIDTTPEHWPEIIDFLPSQRISIWALMELGLLQGAFRTVISWWVRNPWSFLVASFKRRILICKSLVLWS